MSIIRRQSHVLVIDDTQEILDLLRELLENDGYQVSTSLAALDLTRIKEMAPDVIVQDLLFEHSSEIGWSFLILSRLDPQISQIPLILCTAAIQVVKNE